MGARARKKRDGKGSGVAWKAPRLRLPGTESLYRDLVERAPQVLGCGGPLAAQTWFAGIWGDVVDAVPRPDVLEPMLLDLVDVLEAGASAAETGDRAAAARIGMLWTMAEAAPAAAIEAAASAAARAQSRRAELTLPGWVDLLGTAVMERCEWFLGDAFGETVHLVCRYAYADGTDPHAVWTVLDRTHRWAPIVIRMIEGGNVGPFLASLGEDDPPQLSPPRPLGTGTACRLLRSALAAAGHLELRRLGSGPVLDPESVTVLPLLDRRVTRPGRPEAAAFDRDDPETDDAARLALRWPQQRRAALVAQFLAQDAARWGDRPAAGQLAERLADLSIGVLGWPPDRVSPRSVRTMVDEVLPRALILPEALVPDLEQVVPAWWRWLVGRAGAPAWPGGLAAADRHQLESVVAQAPGRLGHTYRDRKVNTRLPYVADVPAPDGRAGDLSDVLSRRVLAVPLPGDRGAYTIDLPGPVHGLRAGEHDVDDLDAAHPAHRGLVERLLAREAGCGPAMTEARVGVVHQFWADDPPEVWPAGLRLLEGGRSRTDALEQLARLWRRHAPPGDAVRTGEAGRGEAAQAYRQALAVLGSGASTGGSHPR